MTATGEPRMLDLRRGLDYGATPGVYYRQPAVTSLGEAVAAEQSSVNLLATAAELQPCAQIWQVVTTDPYGTPTGSCVTTETPSCVHLWDPATCTGGTLVRRLGEVVDNCKWGCHAAPENKKAVVRTHDFTVPELVRSVPVLAPATPDPAQAAELSVFAAQHRGNTRLTRRVREGGGVWLNNPCYAGACLCNTLAVTSGISLYPATCCGGSPYVPEVTCVPIHPETREATCWIKLGSIETGVNSDCGYSRPLELLAVQLKPWAYGMTISAQHGVGKQPIVKVVTCAGNPQPMSYMEALPHVAVTSCTTAADMVPPPGTCDAVRYIQWRQLTAPAPACYAPADMLVGRYWRYISPTTTDWAPHSEYSWQLT